MGCPETVLPHEEFCLLVVWVHVHGMPQGKPGPSGCKLDQHCLAMVKKKINKIERASDFLRSLLFHKNKRKLCHLDDAPMIVRENANNFQNTSTSQLHGKVVGDAGDSYKPSGQPSDKCAAFSYFRRTAHSYQARGAPHMRLPQREVVEAAVARFVVLKQAKANGRAVLFFLRGS